MSTSADNPGSARPRWVVTSSDGAVYRFSGGARAIVDEVIPDGTQVETIRFEVDLDPGWRLTTVLRIGDGGAEPIEVCFSEIGGESDRSRWELFKTLGMGGARSQIKSGLELLQLQLPTSESLRLTSRRPGRRARPDSFYAAKAKAWCEALAAHPERPTRFLVECYPSTTVKGWQGWLKIAEQRGLFERPSGGSAGRAVGQMTAEGMKALGGPR